MELKALFLGLAFLVSIFAVKSGAGFSYLRRQVESILLQPQYANFY